MFIEISQNLQENSFVAVCFLIKLQACNLIQKVPPTQLFSCEFCEIFKNVFFYRTPLVAASATANQPIWNQYSLHLHKNQSKDLEIIEC